MNKKNIAKMLKRKLDDWCKNIDNEEVKKVIKENAIITGGALVSLLNNETPNDYDVYFKTYESVLTIAQYYAGKWNTTKNTKLFIIPDTELFDTAQTDKREIYTANELLPMDKWYNNVPVTAQFEALQKNNERLKRITCFIASKGIASEENETGIDDNTEPLETAPFVEDEETKETPEYRPRYFSTNAISLSDGIQIVIRFYGNVEQIHENYDYVHCTCSYDYNENKVNLPPEALEAIINKELFYTGSKYPLCSIIRSRKFITRGWTINAGQYLKMALQLNELNLKDLKVFKDQLAGVDSAYFDKAIGMIIKKQEENPEFAIDNTYLFEVINKIF